MTRAPATIRYAQPAWLEVPRCPGVKVRLWQTSPDRFAPECSCGWSGPRCNSRGMARERTREHLEASHGLGPDFKGTAITADDDREFDYGR